MANKHILRIHETESDLLSELKDKQIAWATDINEAIWRNGNNFYYIEASKYWNGSEFIEINSDQIYNVYNWDDYLTALSDVGNIKYIYMRENIQAPSVLTQNIDVYGQCEIIVYTGSQIFSFDPSGASNCELRYRGASGSPNFTSLNFLGNSITYVGFETLFVEDVYCRNEDIISSLPIDVQITSGAELGTPKFQYESQDGNFTCSVGTSDFIRELWTVPIFEIQTIGSAEGYKPKGTDFLNNGSSVYSNMSQADISENFSGDVYTNAFLGLTFTTSQLSGLFRKRFIGGSVLWSFNNLDVWNPSTFSDNPISFIGRGIDFTSGVSIDEDKLCSLTLAPSTSNATLKIGDITDTQNDIYVEVLNIDGDLTLDPTSTHNIYYEKINLNGFTLTDSGNVAVQQFWNNTNDSSGGGSQDLDSVLTQGNTSTLGAEFGDLVQINNASQPEFIVGDDTDTNDVLNMGFRSQIVKGANLVVQDYKTRFGGTVLFRSGVASEKGSARTWLSLDPSTGVVTLPNSLTITGNQKGVLGNKSDNETMPFTNRTAQGTGAEMRLGHLTALGNYGQLKINDVTYFEWFSDIISVRKPIKFQSLTNSSPQSGEVYNDGTSIKIESDVTVNGSITATIPTGTQVGLVGYDANGKLIQGTGGGGGVTPGSWTNVTLASNIGVRSGYRPLRYRSDGIDGVQVEGTCKYNTGFNLAPGFTVVLFTFASGSRPNNDFNVKAQVGYNGSTTEIDAWAHIDASTGQVTLKNSDAVAISELYDISFNFRFSLT